MSLDHYFEVAQRLEAGLKEAHSLREEVSARLDKAEARIEQQKKAHAERKRMIDEARVVLDDCFASGEPRSTAHALEALRRIICGTGLVAFGQPVAPTRTDAEPVMRVAVTAEQAQQDALWALNRANTRSAAERRVLNAMAQIREPALRRLRKDNGGSVADAIDAELARREAKP